MYLADMKLHVLPSPFASRGIQRSNSSDVGAKVMGSENGEIAAALFMVLAGMTTAVPELRGVLTGPSAEAVAGRLVAAVATRIAAKVVFFISVVISFVMMIMRSVAIADRYGTFCNLIVPFANIRISGSNAKFICALRAFAGIVGRECKTAACIN